MKNVNTVNSYVVIKDIPFIETLKVGALVTSLENSVYNVSFNGKNTKITIPGFNCTSKEYFKPYIAPKFANNEYVLASVNRNSCKKTVCRVIRFNPNRRSYILGIMPGTISAIENSRLATIEVYESDIIKTYIYWFINSEGKACPAAVGQSKDRDLWCKACGNMFDSASKATDHARKVIASTDCEILIDNE